MGLLKTENHNKWIANWILRDWSRYYRHRDMLIIPGASGTDGPHLSIMTYNIMYRCSAERYKTQEGDSFSRCRFEILSHEISTYNADIVCLQELETDELHHFIKCFHELGYEFVFSRHNVNNTMAICYKKRFFSQILTECDLYSTDLPDASYCRNCAMLLALEFKPEYIESFAGISNNCLIIANTHLQPFECHKDLRAEETAMLLKHIKEFTERAKTSSGSNESYRFLCGDFNSSADDPAYLSMVAKPFQWGKSSEVSKLHSQIADSHNHIMLRAVSLYSVGYRLVDRSRNAVDDVRKEPSFTFWGPFWHGVCDYIFNVCDWEGDECTKVDSVEELAQLSNVRLLALLEIPHKYEMGGPLPQVKSFPSDHLCLMAEVELI